MSEIEKLNNSQLSVGTASSKTSKTSSKTVKQSSTRTVTSTVTKSSSSSSSTSSSTTKAEEKKESSSSSKSKLEQQSIENNEHSSPSSQLVPSTSSPQQTASQKKAVETVVVEKVEVQSSESVKSTRTEVGPDGEAVTSEEMKEEQKVEKALKRDEKKQEVIEKMCTDETGQGVCLAQMIKEEASSSTEQSAAEASAFSRSGPDGCESGHHEDAKQDASFRREIHVQANAAAYIEKLAGHGEMLSLVSSANPAVEEVSSSSEMLKTNRTGDQSDHATLNFKLDEMETESIRIIIENNKMSVHAMKKKRVGDEETKEEFSRVYDLPEDQIDQNKVTSSIYQDGVLSIELPYKSAILGL